MAHQHYRTVVRREHPHRERWRAAIVLAVIGLAGAVGYWLGSRSDASFVPFDTEQIRLRDQIAQLILQTEADRQTLGALRSSLAEQATEMAELEQMLSFYRGVLAPELPEDPVVIRSPTVQWLGADGGWKIQLVVHRGTPGDAVFAGNLTLTLEGQRAGEPASVNVAELDSEKDSGVFPLRFRYLRQIQAVVSLPEAFVPERIESVVALVEPVAARYRRSDLWGDTLVSGELAQFDQTQ